MLSIPLNGFTPQDQESTQELISLSIPLNGFEPAVVTPATAEAGESFQFH